jgi:hypothetical protein
MSAMRTSAGDGSSGKNGWPLYVVIQSERVARSVLTERLES